LELSLSGGSASFVGSLSFVASLSILLYTLLLLSPLGPGQTYPYWGVNLIPFHLGMEPLSIAESLEGKLSSIKNNMYLLKKCCVVNEMLDLLIGMDNRLFFQ
jgi:hypothetical protein